jgi:hypothetical protein
VGTCESGNEPSVSIKGRKFLDQLSDYQFLKKVFVPWSESLALPTYKSISFSQMEAFNGMQASDLCHKFPYTTSSALRDFHHCPT